MIARRMMLLVTGLLVVAAPLACSSDRDDDSATSTTAFEDRTHDTWRDGDDDRGSVSPVTGVLRSRDPGACTVIEVDGEARPVTWPPGSTRTEEGISVGGHLYRFDELSEFRVIEEYDGPSRPVTCVTTSAWLVLPPG